MALLNLLGNAFDQDLPAVRPNMPKMPPMAATVCLSTAACCMLQIRRARARDTWTYLCIVNMALTLGFLVAYMAPRGASEGSEVYHLMLPGAAALFFLLNAALLSAEPDNAVLREFVESDLAAALGRKHLAVSSAAVVGLFLLWLRVNHAQIITQREGSALWLSATLVVLGAMAHRQGRLARSVMRLQEQQMGKLRRAASQQALLTQSLGQERNWLKNITAAVKTYSLIGTDIHGTVMTFNEGAQALLGYAPGEVVGKVKALLFHDPEEVVARAETLQVEPGMEVFLKVPKFGVCEQREWTYVRKDQSRVSVWLAVTSMQDEGGKIIGFLGVARDLSADKRNRRDRDGFLQIGQELLSILDRQGRFVQVSPAFERTLGYSAAALVGHALADYVHCDDLNGIHRCLAEVLAGNRVERFVTRCRTAAGGNRWVAWNFTPPGDEDTFYASGWDITDERARAGEQAEQLVFEQRLIGIVSHDLRSPIAAISLSARSMQRLRGLTGRVEVGLQRVVDAAARAERMIHDLLDFTQARLGQHLRINPRPMEAVAALRQVIEEVRTAWPGRQIVLTAPPACHLVGDRDRLAQLFVNLLSNSLKYSPPDTPVRVSVHSSEHGLVMVVVHNDGPPIPTNLLSRIFRPMERGTHAQDAQRSVGLGLYIVQQIALAHAGRVDVESSSSGGTFFYVRLPQRWQGSMPPDGVAA